MARKVDLPVFLETFRRKEPRGGMNCIHSEKKPKVNNKLAGQVLKNGLKSAGL